MYASDCTATKISSLFIQFKQMLAVITFASRKCFGPADTKHRWLEVYKSAGRERLCKDHHHYHPCGFHFLESVMYLYNNMCLVVEICHSTPRNTWEISMKWSSTTFAKWYVGYPSDFMMTGSPSFSVILVLPYTRSSKDTSFDISWKDIIALY